MPAVSVADALFGTVRQRTLALLFGHSKQRFYVSEIIRRIGAGSGAVQRELARLAAAGLVTVTRVGRQKHYQANERAPVFDEIRSIVLKTSGLGDVLRGALAPFEDRISSAFVFGSIAAGIDTADSDVDLMVITDRLTYAELFEALEAASAELLRQVNPTIYTSAELDRRVAEANPFVTKVLSQKRIRIIGGEVALPS